MEKLVPQSQPINQLAIDATVNECEKNIAASVREHLNANIRDNMLLLDITMDSGEGATVAVAPRGEVITNEIIRGVEGYQPMELDAFINLASYTTYIHAPTIAILAETMRSFDATTQLFAHPDAPLAVMVGQTQVLALAPTDCFERTEPCIDYQEEVSLDDLDNPVVR